MDESQKHYEKQKKPDTKKYILWFHWYILEQAKLIYGDSNQNSGCLCGMKINITFWGHGSILHPNICQMHTIILWRSVHCTVDKSYLNLKIQTKKYILWPHAIPTELESPEVESEMLYLKNFLGASDTWAG